MTAVWTVVLCLVSIPVGHATGVLLADIAWRVLRR